MYHITSSNINNNNNSNKQNNSSNNNNNNNDKTKFNSKILVIVLIGILFHAVFTLSIFDIYFRSPLVHGMTPHHIELPPPAKRLILFVADGLRADKFFEIENGESRAPFLRNIIENNGSWGISHTRVPTETRPGHVALIAGFYEDVSAVTKGWKANPVEFDHFFNETTYSWGYGSPDVVPMFSENVPHMHSESYPEEAEDFSSDASKLDVWVFEKIEQLFKNASTHNHQLNKRLRSDKVSIFLHLLGLDTNGHAYRPNSKEYLDNIKLVDRGIEKIVGIIEEFYGNDGKTAYVFTADHGMSNRGSHGDGERANTETPLVVWGSGVRGPLSSDLQMERIASLRGKAKEKLQVNIDTPSNWGKLVSLFRSDVSQADIAPLMSSLIGVPSPLNSVGVLPTELLQENNPQYTTAALYANTKQIWEMYKIKSSSKQESTLLFFSPFTLLTDANKMFDSIDQFIATQQLEDAQILCHELIDLCLMGLNYFQTYDRPFLMTVITLGYFGWIITLLLYVLNNYTSFGVADCNPQKLSTQIKRFKTLSFYLILVESIALIGFLVTTDAPLLYYLYCVFLVLFWGKTIPSNIVPLYIFICDSFSQVSSTRGHFISSGSNTSNTFSIIKNFILLGLSAIFVMELLVVSYFRRGVLSLLYQILGVVSTFFFYGNASANKLFKLFWLVSCLLMSIFPSLPIDYGNDTKLVCLGGVLITVLAVLQKLFKFGKQGGANIKSSGSKNSGSSKSQIINSILMFSILLSAFIVYTTDSSLEQKIGLPYINQILSWFLLVSSIIVLSIYRGKGFYDHWTFLCLGISIPFLLLSISYEVLFFGSLILNLTLWMYLELKIDNDHTIPKLVSITPSSASSSSDPSLTSLSFSKSAIKSNLMNITQHDIRRAIFYIFFCYVGFFGVGNIASISSFEISSTYRFTTIFSPFLMGALLLVKIFIPLLLVAVSFSLLNNNLNVPRPGSFLIVVALADIMSLNFFFLVKDTGSWLEIGTSISHYGISNAFIILQLLLFAVSSLLVPTTLKSLNNDVNDGKSK